MNPLKFHVFLWATFHVYLHTQYKASDGATDYFLIIKLFALKEKQKKKTGHLGGWQTSKHVMCDEFDF